MSAIPLHTFFLLHIRPHQSADKADVKSTDFRMILRQIVIDAVLAGNACKASDVTLD